MPHISEMNPLFEYEPSTPQDPFFYTVESSLIPVRVPPCRRRPSPTRATSSSSSPTPLPNARDHSLLAADVPLQRARPLPPRRQRLHTACDDSLLVADAPPQRARPVILPTRVTRPSGLSPLQFEPLRSLSFCPAGHFFGVAQRTRCSQIT